MTTEQPEDREVKLWAEVIRDLMIRVPQDKRAAVLAKLTQREAAAQAKRAEGPQALKLTTPTEFQARDDGYWNDVLNAKSAVISTFLRTVANSNHPDRRAGILFQPHRGPGSGYLGDYLGNVTGVTVDHEKVGKLVTEFMRDRD
jgi:hypothetical protein